MFTYKKAVLTATKCKRKQFQHTLAYCKRSVKSAAKQGKLSVSVDCDIEDVSAINSYFTALGYEVTVKVSLYDNTKRLIISWALCDESGQK